MSPASSMLLVYIKKKNLDKLLIYKKSSFIASDPRMSLGLHEMIVVQDSRIEDLA